MILKLKNVRLSFPDLYVPKAFKDGEPKFGATFLVPKTSALHKEIEKAILDAATVKFGAKAAKIIEGIRSNPNKFCYQDGDTKEYDGYEGCMALRAKRDSRPLIVDADKNPLTQADGKPYAGCYVNATVEIFAYTNSGNGISAQLRGVQFVKDGDSFGAGTPVSEDEFDMADGSDGDNEGDLA